MALAPFVEAPVNRGNPSPPIDVTDFRLTESQPWLKITIDLPWTQLGMTEFDDIYIALLLNFGNKLVLLPKLSWCNA